MGDTVLMSYDPHLFTRLYVDTGPDGVASRVMQQYNVPGKGDPEDGSRQIGPRQIGPRQIGPLENLAANWAPANRALFGAQFAIFWQIGPRQIGPLDGKLGPGKSGPARLGPLAANWAPKILLWQMGPPANWATKNLFVANWAPPDWAPWRQIWPRKIC